MQRFISVIALVTVATITHAQNVGIGTISPTDARLQVHSDATETQILASPGSNQVGVSSFVPFSSPSVGFNTKYISNGYKYMGTGYSGMWQYWPTVGSMRYYYSTASGVTNGAATMNFALGIDNTGRLGIGTTTPTAPLHVTGNVVFGGVGRTPATGYQVSVDGKVMCEELKVQLSGSWPDYVFKTNYLLRPLPALESYLIQNQHLPGIPSAVEIEKNGIEVGDMNKRLLQKIEELTLYIIELDKQNKILSDKVINIEAKLNTANHK